MNVYKQWAEQTLDQQAEERAEYLRYLARMGRLIGKAYMFGLDSLAADERYDVMCCDMFDSHHYQELRESRHAT